MANDEKVLIEACKAIKLLEAASKLAREESQHFTAFDSIIASLEDWAYMWAAESEFEEECHSILIKFKIKS